jgi:membrane protease YdiL (CAAX protease family)
MPRWAIWICSVLVIAVLAGFAHLLKWAGTEFAFGTFFGMCLNYVIYKNWRQDYENEKRPHFTEN